MFAFKRIWFAMVIMIAKKVKTKLKVVPLIMTVRKISSDVKIPEDASTSEADVMVKSIVEMNLMKPTVQSKRCKSAISMKEYANGSQREMLNGKSRILERHKNILDRY